MGTGTQFIGVEERTPAFVHINIRQDGMSSTYLIKVHHNQIIDPDLCNVRQQLVRVGKAGKLVLVEISHWIKSCYLRNDSMLTMQCNKKMLMNGKTKKMMERQPHWRTFKATFIFVLFLT